jgi:SAM-dependent methyltransferase
MNGKAYVGTELELFAHAHHWKKYLARVMAPFLVGHVLEVGAGLGSTTRALCDGSQASWTCLEPDAALAARLRSRIEAGDLPACCSALEGDVGTLPAHRLFDTIVYVDVLEHIADDRAELERAARHLKGAGYLVVMGPAHAFLFSPFDEAVGHHRRYSRRTLGALAPPGLKPIRSDYLDAVGMIASLANRLVLGRSSPTIGQVKAWDRYMVPFSARIDAWLGHRLGKSVLAVWQSG